MYSAVPYKKGDWIVSVCWYEFVSSKQNRVKDRFYKKGFSQWIPCGSIIRTLTQSIVLRWSGQHFRLSNALHEHIEQHGDLY